MQKIFVIAVLLAATPGLAATASAKTPKSSGATGAVVHIDRQCTRYGVFCASSGSTKAGNAGTYYAAPKSRTRQEQKPFIERQCTRYGNFCSGANSY